MAQTIRKTKKEWRLILNQNINAETQQEIQKVKISSTWKRWLVRGLLVLVILLGLSLVITEVYLWQIQPTNLQLPPPTEGETLNILLIGTDAGLLDGGGTMPPRSDVLMLFSFDPKTNETAVVSIPRDTLVYLDGVGYNRINASHVFGGTAMTLNAVEELLDTSIHYYAKINFQGFKTLVDSIGGVTIDVDIDMFYEDPYAIPPLKIDLKAGYQVLDGDKAEQYVRYRNETGDIGRVERQQKFMSALIQQLLKPTVWLRAPIAAVRLQPYLETNMHVQHGIKFVIDYFFGKEPYHTTLPGVGQYIDGASYWISNGWTLQEIWQQWK
jgi:LCP family protein required for cell wall assembly